MSYSFCVRLEGDICVTLLEWHAKWDERNQVLEASIIQSIGRTTIPHTFVESTGEEILFEIIYDYLSREVASRQSGSFDFFLLCCSLLNSLLNSSSPINSIWKTFSSVLSPPWSRASTFGQYKITAIVVHLSLSVLWICPVSKMIVYELSYRTAFGPMATLPS